MTLPEQGLRAKLIKFFEANPEEELTFQDIQEKYEVGVACCSRAVRMLADEGLVEDKPRVIRKARSPTRGLW
jgi:Fic family protein